VGRKTLYISTGVGVLNPLTGVFRTLLPSAYIYTVLELYSHATIESKVQSSLSLHSAYFAGLGRRGSDPSPFLNPGFSKRS
jgi:hypothetical protein